LAGNIYISMAVAVFPSRISRNLGEGGSNSG
jgi:hypothetical protein